MPTETQIEMNEEAVLTACKKAKNAILFYFDENSNRSVPSITVWSKGLSHHDIIDVLQGYINNLKQRN
jgi:hypothetical protein